MRLLAAIDLPPALRDNLYLIGRQVNGAHPVPSDQIHLTLFFIGEVHYLITDTLAAIKSEVFVTVMQGLGRFQPRGQLRII